MNILKWTLTTGEQTISMPEHAEIISAQEQQGAIVMWALCPEYVNYLPRKFLVWPTGTSLPVYTHLAHVSTVQLIGGSLVYHVFDLGYC